jgi:hypothetical protein
MVTYDARPSAFTQMTTTGEWEYLHTAIGAVTAIDASVGSAMVPSLDTGGRNAVIADGVVAIKGQLWRCDAPVSTPIPAASAQNRIDRLVLRLTRGATTSATVVVPTVITGTPSGSPVMPPIVQTSTGIWDVPVCSWTSTSAGAITTLVDQRRMTNDPWHDMRPLSAANWAGTVAGMTPPQYRFSQDLTAVEVAGKVQTNNTSGNMNNVVFFTFPTNYRPQLAQRYLVTDVADGAASPIVSINANGTMSFNYLPNPLATTQIGIGGRFPLDDQFGFIQS